MKMFKGKAVYWKGKEKVEKGKIEIANIKKGQVLVEVKYCGICGTDLAIYRGLHPRSKPPLIMGHEFSGIVKSAESKLFNEGDRVVVNPLISCGECSPCQQGLSYICQNLKLIGIDSDGGFAKYAVVDEDKLYKIPEGLDLKTASLIEPFATGAHAMRVANPRKNDLIVILGGGPIGIATGLFFKHNGFENIYISEISRFRQDVLKKFGFNVIDPKEEDLKEKIIEISDSKLADIVLEATGAARPILDMVPLAKVRGLIVLVGISHRPANVDLMNVVFKELTIKGIRVYSREDFRDAVEFVSKNRGLLEEYISSEFELNDLDRAIEYAGDSTKSTKVVLKIV